jgi:hypothetical protein
MRSVVELTDKKHELMRTIDRLEKCRLAICYSWYSLKSRRIFNSYQESLMNYDKKLAKAANQIGGKESLVFFTKMPNKLKDEDAYKRIANNWYEASISMKNSANNRGILYFHIIQPNQYHQTNRVFTQKEKTEMITPSHPYAEGATKGYPQILSRVKDLQNAQINVFSAVNIFDTEKETIYRDACCHFNELGENIFADFIFNNIQTTLQQNPSLLNPPK